MLLYYVQAWIVSCVAAATDQAIRG